MSEKSVSVQITCRGCGMTETIDTFASLCFYHTIADKNVATGFCPSCAPKHEEDREARYLTVKDKELHNERSDEPKINA